MANPDIAEQAAAMFSQRYNCAQSVLACCGAKLGMDRDLAVRLAAGLGGGLARGETCGAVSGAILVLGLRYASLDPQDAAAKAKVYELTRQLQKRFEQRNKTVRCNDLLGCDMATAAGQQQAREKGLLQSLCPKLVKDAAEIVEQMLAE